MVEYKENEEYTIDDIKELLTTVTVTSCAFNRGCVYCPLVLSGFNCAMPIPHGITIDEYSKIILDNLKLIKN